MALWGGRFTGQQINGSNNSTTHCALITVWRSRILLALWHGQSHGHGRRVNRRRAGATGRGAERVAGRCSRQPQQILESDAEDIHSWVEGKLIDKVGQLGKSCIPGVAVMIR